MRRGQTWSFDMFFAITLFILVFAIFIGITVKVLEQEQETRVRDEARVIAVEITGDSSVSVVKGNVIQEEQLEERALTSYDSLRQELGVSNNFCIYLEDAEGTIIPIQLSNGTVYGIGSNASSFAGNPCGQIITTVP